MNMNLMNLFTDEEKLYINEFCKSERLNKLSKKMVLNKISFARSVAPEEKDIIQLIEDVYSKIKSLKEEEWGLLKKLFPLEIAFEISQNDKETSI